jgi:hypothetical protein
MVTQAELPPRVDDFCEHCRPKALAVYNFARRVIEEIAEGLEAINQAPHDELTVEPTTTPEDTLREAGISTKRQAKYQRRLSRLLAGRS